MFFSLFRLLVLEFGYCLMISWLSRFFGFMPSVSLTGSYSEDEPVLGFSAHVHS